MNDHRIISGCRGLLSTRGAMLLPLLAGFLAATAVTADDEHPTSAGIPGVRGGVVATSEPNAARVGIEVLRTGGNAIDAAAAVQFALNVVEPESSGIGGGGFMMIHLAGQNKTVIVDSREQAPAAATPDMFVPFLAYDRSRVFDLASTSGVSVGVPGTVLGVATALREWGSLSLAEVLAPAIRLAEEGFRVGPQLAESSESERLQNEPGNAAYEAARRTFRPAGAALQEGGLLRQPDLARTLKLIARQGTDVFYRGEIAEAIVRTQQASRSDPQTGQPIAAGSGRMTRADLENYRLAIREPVSGSYRGDTLHGMGPPSSGALTSIQILKLLERFPIGDPGQGFGFGTPRTLHVMVEAMRLAFADRALWIGDSDFVQIPETGLLNQRYLAERSLLIDPDSRMQQAPAGDPRPYLEAAAGSKSKLAVSSPGLQKGRNTTHFTIIDRQGNIVSYTSTIESAWGSGLMVPGYGFLLNNELTDFNFSPTANAAPDNFNPGANDVAPTKRPRSSMAPTILFKDGKPVAAYGSPGGATIIDSVVNITVNLIDHGMDIQEAVDAPRIAQTSANGSLRREIGFSEPALNALETLGHKLYEPEAIGSVQGIVIDQRRGLQYGAADRRRVGGVRSLRQR